jgi:hypothetical protein
MTDEKNKHRDNENTHCCLAVARRKPGIQLSAMRAGNQ